MLSYQFGMSGPSNGRKPDTVAVSNHSMSTKILGLGIFMTGVLILSIALIMGLEFPKYVYNKLVEEQCIINENHPKYREWSDGLLWDRYNRVYYWLIENKDEFLYQGKPPKLRERGPYVYKERQIKFDVSFIGTQVSFRLISTYEFQADLTIEECGQSCTANEELTVFNLNYFEKSQEYGGYENFAFAYMPDVITKSLDSLASNVSSSNVYSYLGNCDAQSESSWIISPKVPLSLDPFSFGGWIAENNTSYKDVILRFLNGANFSDIQMRGIYTILSDRAVLGATKDHFQDEPLLELCKTLPYLTVDFINSMNKKFQYEITISNYTLDNTSVSFYTLKDKTCGLLAYLRYYSSISWILLAGYMEQLLCQNVDSCFKFQGPKELVTAYLQAIREYILNHLTIFVNFLAFENDKNDIIIRSTQKQIALGYLSNVHVYDIGTDYFVNGVLTNRADAIEFSNVRPVYLVSTCLENRDVNNNFKIIEYNDTSLSPASMFPLVAEYDRRLRGYTEFTPPIRQKRACDRISQETKSLEFFVPELWRHALFINNGPPSTVDATRSTYKMPTGVFTEDGKFILRDGYQDMSPTTGYVSWISYPGHFGPVGNQTAVNGDTKYEYSGNSYIDIEPATGRVWQKNISLQHNLGIRSQDVLGRRRQTLNVTSLNVPIPLYWVEKTMKISSKELGYYHQQVTYLMDVSCGGLIGLSIIAILVMIIGVVICFHPGSNRVAPMIDVIPMTHRSTLLNRGGSRIT